VVAQLHNQYTGTIDKSPAADEGQWLKTHDAALAAAYTPLLAPERVRTSSMVLVGSMALFLGAEIVSGGSWGWAVTLVGILFLHELGHFAGMRWFGYQDVQMFFIPFMGAAVSGQPRAVAAWKDGVVTLLGPLPGIMLGLVLAIVNIRLGRQWVYQLADLMIGLNALNLLPVMPLDGGRLLHRTLFSRHIALEIAAGVLSIMALFGLALLLKSGWLVALAFWMGTFLVQSYRNATAVRWLRRTEPDLPIDPAALDERQRFALFNAARLAVPDAMLEQTTAVTAAMRHLLESMRPMPSWSATAALLAAWAGGLIVSVVAAVLLVAAPPASWARHECEGLGVGAEFPIRPMTGGREIAETPDGSRPAISCSAVHEGTLYTITMYTTGDSLDEARRQAWLTRFADGGTFGRVEKTSDGFESADMVSERQGQLRHRLIFAGSLVFRVSTLGAPEENAHRFMSSFRVTR